MAVEQAGMDDAMCQVPKRRFDWFVMSERYQTAQWTASGFWQFRERVGTDSGQTGGELAGLALVGAICRPVERGSMALEGG